MQAVAFAVHFFIHCCLLKEIKNFVVSRENEITVRYRLVKFLLSLVIISFAHELIECMYEQVTLSFSRISPQNTRFGEAVHKDRVFIKYIIAKGFKAENSLGGLTLIFRNPNKLATSRHLPGTIIGDEDHKSWDPRAPMIWDQLMGQIFYF